MTKFKFLWAIGERSREDCHFWGDMRHSAVPRRRQPLRPFGQGTVPQRIGKLLHKQNFADVPLACEGLNKSPSPPAARRASPATRPRCSWKLRDYLLWSSRLRPEAGEDQKLKTSGKELLLHQDAWRERQKKRFHLYQTASNNAKLNLSPRIGEGLRAVKTNKLVLLMPFLTFLSCNAHVQSPEEDSFIDSGDYCDICGFRFNDPIKAKKPITKCRVCSKNVNKPRIEKDGGTCQQ